MNRNTALLSWTSIVIAINVGPGTARALHIDVLSEQVNGQIVTGTGNFDNDTWTLGERVYHRDLGPTPAPPASPTYLSNNNPGFNSIGDGSPDMPAGAQALLPGATLSWDFLPMTINNLSQNLFYWNGQDSDGVAGFTPADVHFGALPTPAYTLKLLDFNNVIYAVDGTNTIVPGGKIAKTAADGSLHQHLLFALQDNDGNDATLPVDGLYLIAMRLKLPGLQDSLPVFMVFGTPGSSISAEDDAAVPWVEQQLNIPGDYNQNGVVDAADYVLWRKTLNLTATPMGSGADGDGDGTIETGDFTFWRQHFGNASLLLVNTGSGAGSSQGLGAGTVPEPSNVWLFVLGCLIVLGFIERRRTTGEPIPCDI
jgi:Dockerin type I domain